MSVDADLATVREALNNWTSKYDEPKTELSGPDAFIALARVEAELSRLREERDFWQGTANEMAETEVPNLIKRYQKRIRAAEARCARLQQALAWYAERRNYMPAAGSTMSNPAKWIFEHDSFDGNGPGARAREALAGTDTPTHRKQSVEYWRARARAAETRCERLQQALQDLHHEASTRKLGVKMDGSTEWGNPFHKRVYEITDEALAGPDTPADSQEDKT